VGRDKLDRACRIYAPVGSHETLLAYLVRRLLENGANSSFVNRIVDPAVSIESLVVDPVAVAEKRGGVPHANIPLPAALLPGRRNSQGADLADDATLAALAAGLEAASVPRAATPILVSPSTEPPSAPIVIRNPASLDDVIGTVIESTASDVARAVTTAIEDGRAWSATPPATRSACLERAADLLEAERATFLALAVREAGKTLANAMSEVREATDFLRYYATQARAELAAPGVAPIGPVVAISPWNFPLAIFVGEVAAALAAGNPVLAKPAEQTPLIAYEAVRVLHRAGVPLAALQFLPGRGEIVGAALVSDPRVAGVIFTGSTDVARGIARALAPRADGPVLIAETGGQNAMIVDSSALSEQVVADALVSAFDSAGQRCSALRLLCVQDDVAPEMLTMLEGAMRELAVGDPRRLAVDVGPVIDEDARAALATHVTRMRAAGLRVVEMALPAECARGTFIAPTLVDLGGIGGLKHLEREVFGPILHVLRWRRGELAALVDAVNATGYGLTHGIQTRIDETVAAILARIEAGNVYVNRNIVGAVVGVQPFGGHRLSGTGPKAGGPLYLRRLARNASAPVPTSAIALPGPTGESNTLEFHPRGVVLCLARDERTLVAQAKAALAFGNRVMMLREPNGLAARDRLEPVEVMLSDKLDPAAVDAVLLDVSAERARRVRTEFAEATGPIVPIVECGRDGQCDWMRLVVERTVTVNAAAAGGNAALLSLSEDAA